MSEQAPSVSQRCHRYANSIGADPLQLPRSAVNVCPSRGAPETAGALVLAGAMPATTSVGADEAEWEPPALVAVTTARTVEPTSTERRRNVESVAPAIVAHAPPEASQRRHSYPYPIGWEAVSVPVQ